MQMQSSAEVLLQAEMGSPEDLFGATKWLQSREKNRAGRTQHCRDLSPAVDQDQAAVRLFPAVRQLIPRML